MKKINFGFYSITLYAVVVISAFIMTSCEKENDNTTNEDSMSGVIDDNFASDTYNDVVDLADEAAENDSKSASSECAVLSDCVTVTKDMTSNPRVTTIDFGTEGCTGADGKIRKGKIIVFYGGDYWADGAVRTITFDNYYVDEYKVAGIQIITVGANNSTGNRFYSELVTGSIEWANSDSVILWSAEHTRELIEGSSTRRISDDVYQLSGYSTGTSSDDEKYTSVITLPLIRKVEAGCRYNYVEGLLEITPIGKATRIIDYGEGTCDRKATVTVNENVYSIYLR